MTLVVEEIAFCAEPEEGALSASVRCVGRSPEGPGLDERGMEVSAFIMASLEILRGGGGEDGENGLDVPCGCFSSIVLTVDEEASAMPLEVKAEQARERSPSDASLRARVALSVCWRSFAGMGDCDLRLSASVRKKCQSWLMFPAKSILHRERMSFLAEKSGEGRPRLGGGRRQSLARAILTSHISGVLYLVTQVSVSATTSAYVERACLGMCWKVGV